jgi:hypothetical protein
MVRVLGPWLARVIAGDIPSATATRGLNVVSMSRMRVINAVGVPGAFGVRYHARRKVRGASPAGGVPEKKGANIPRQLVCISY